MTEIAGANEVVLERHVRAAPTRVFDAWIDPEELVRWWGPSDVECVEADVDLRIGGSFRLANRMHDASIVWITGTYEQIDRPRLLRFSWTVDGSESGPASVVTVRFAERRGGTDVTVTHERISTSATRDDHERGWEGCLDGLACRFAPTAVDPR